MIQRGLEGLVGEPWQDTSEELGPEKWSLRRDRPGWLFGHVRAWEVAVDLG